MATIQDLIAQTQAAETKAREQQLGQVAKARATLEDIRMERRAQALSGLAGFEAGVEYESPDYSTLMQAVASGTATPSQTPAAGQSLWSKDILSMPTGGTYAGQPTSVKGTGAMPGGTVTGIQMAAGTGPAYGTTGMTTTPTTAPKQGQTTTKGNTQFKFIRQYTGPDGGTVYSYMANTGVGGAWQPFTSRTPV